MLGLGSCDKKQSYEYLLKWLSFYNSFIYKLKTKLTLLYLILSLNKQFPTSLIIALHRPESHSLIHYSYLKHTVKNHTTGYKAQVPAQHRPHSIQIPLLCIAFTWSIGFKRIGIIRPNRNL